MTCCYDSLQTSTKSLDAGCSSNFFLIWFCVKSYDSFYIDIAL